MGGELLGKELVEGRPAALLVTADGGAPQVLPATAGDGDGHCAPPNALRRAIAAAFLPEGFPASTSSDYLPYQLYDSIQGLCSYVRGMLASQALLAGVGVGSAAATPMSAVFQFFVKDFTGMLGGILFASTQGTGFDSYAKQWRLAADVMNDIGLALELASPLLPRAFLLLACLGSLARAVTGVAGGATRMALTQHFALRRNAADIAAKEGSQETAVTLIGMVLGMALIRLAAGLQPAVWAAFWALTAVHVWANVRAMRCLRVTSLNQARLGALLQHYLCTGAALTPEQMALEESLVPPPLQLLLRRLRLGFGAVPLVALAPRLASLSPRLQQRLVAQVQAAAAEERGRRKRGGPRRYVAAAAEGRHGGGVFSHSHPDAAALLRQDAGPADALEAYCAALMLAWGAALGRRPVALWPTGAQRVLTDVPAWLSGDCGDGGGGGYEAFLAALAAEGWALDRAALLQGPSRLAWGGDLRTD